MTAQLPPEGRKVRCSRCKHVWLQRAEDGESGRDAGQSGGAAGPRSRLQAPQRTPAPATPEPSGSPRFENTFAAAFDDDEVIERSWDSTVAVPAPGEDGPSDLRRVPPKVWQRPAVQWGALAAAVLVLMTGGLLGREAIVGSWLPAARLYDAIGLPVDVPGSGLQFLKVQSAVRIEDELPILLVEGQIKNVDHTLRAVPPVRVTSHGPDGLPLDSWVVPAVPSSLLPGELATFVTKRPDPGSAQQVEITFEIEMMG